jgi:hypothetical protein
MNATTPTWAIVGSYPFRQPERVYFNPFNTAEMWVSSFGNGMKIGSNATTGMPVFESSEEGISVYPNPVSGMLHVLLPLQNAALPVSVYNISGQLVSTFIPGNKNEIQINTDAWKPGMYVIYCGNKSAKFIKE